MPNSPIKLYAMTLNDFLLHEDDTIRRNAMSILKRLQKIKTKKEVCRTCNGKDSEGCAYC